MVLSTYPSFMVDPSSSCEVPGKRRDGEGLFAGEGCLEHRRQQRSSSALTLSLTSEDKFVLQCVHMLRNQGFTKPWGKDEKRERGWVEPEKMTIAERRMDCL